MSNQNKANANDPLGIIGKKMKGFKFEDWKHNALNYATVMDNYIGSIGEIISYMEEYDCYYCKFSEYKYFHYPAELIKDYLVDTPQELTLLEKFEQGWEIDRDGVKAVDVRMSKTWGGKVVVEWSNCVVGIYDNSANLFKCTPPKERKTLYTYCSKTGACYVNEDDKPSDGYQLVYITRIESNGDNWEVVKP